MRPGNPTQLIEDVIKLADLAPDSRILEIGCSTGKATLPFAQCGYAMICIEPGPALAQLTGAKCAPYPNVTVQITTFEEWPPQPDALDSKYQIVKPMHRTRTSLPLCAISC